MPFVFHALMKSALRNSFAKPFPSESWTYSKFRPMVEVRAAFLTDTQVVNVYHLLLSHFILCGLCQWPSLIVHGWKRERNDDLYFKGLCISSIEHLIEFVKKGPVTIRFYWRLFSIVSRSFLSYSKIGIISCYILMCSFQKNTRDFFKRWQCLKTTFPGLISKPIMNVCALFTSAPHTNKYSVPRFGSFNPRRSIGIHQIGDWLSQIYILNVIGFVSCNKSQVYRGAVFSTPCSVQEGWERISQRNKNTSEILSS